MIKRAARLIGLTGARAILSPFSGVICRQSSPQIPSGDDSKLSVLRRIRHRFAKFRSLLHVDQGQLSTYARPFPVISQSFRTLLIAFIILDLAFIGLNALAIVAHQFGLIDAVPELLKITKDRALPEDYNYLKWTIIVVALTWMSIRDRWLPPLFWAFVFAMILADDSLQLHEKLGAFISSSSNLPSSTYFYSDDLGELLAFMVMGCVALAMTASLFTRCGATARAISLRYGLVIVALGGFGVGIDSLHQVVSHLAEGTSVATLMSQLFGLLEEGGEMMVASFAAAMTIAGELGSAEDVRGSANS
jgi:hypothetical protein